MSSKTKSTGTKEEATPALVPKLRFPEFRGKEGWKEKPLGKYLRESRIPGSKGNIARKITVKLWGNGVVEKKEAAQGSINTQYFRRRAGQFIYSKLDFLNQAFGIIPKALDGYESTVNLPCFDISEGMDPVFLLGYVLRKDFYERVGEAAEGSRKAKTIQVDTFLECPVALPTPAEQQEIAECLSSVDELMAAQARKVDALKTHKKGLMQQLFPREGETQPRLRFPEFKSPWKIGTVDQLASTVMGNAFRSTDFVESGTQVVRIGNLYQGELQLDRSPVYISDLQAEENIRFIVKPLDLLMSMTGTVGKRDYGFVVQVPETCKPLLLNQRVMKIVPKDNCDPSFLLQMLKGESLLDQLYSIPGGNKQANLSAQNVKDLKISYPLPDEQERIATCLSSLDALITAETQKHEALKTHKKGLMQQLFPSPDEENA